MDGTAAARMRSSDWPGAEREPGVLRRATEVEIVEMKAERRVEAHATLAQAIHLRRDEYPIQKLCRGWRRAVDGDRSLARPAMADRAAEMRMVEFGDVPHPADHAAGPHVPRLLSRLAAGVARNAKHVEALQPLGYTRAGHPVVDVDVVMHEDQQRARRCLLDRNVVAIAERRIVLGEKAQTKRRQLPDARERQAKRRGRFELCPAAARRSHEDQRPAHQPSAPGGRLRANWARASASGTSSTQAMTHSSKRWRRRKPAWAPKPAAWTSCSRVDSV